MSAPAAAAPSATEQVTPEERQSVLRTLRTPRLLWTEVVAGLVVAIALIPEAIAFSVIAGVDPRMGLFAAFAMATTTAIVGGRPAMISGATAATALVIAPLNESHGVDFFIAAVLLAGVFQVVLGLLGVAKLMRFIPRSVMIGFVNALAIMIFMNQLPDLIGVPWLVYPLTALGLVILFVWPRVTRAVPAPLITILLVTAIALLTGFSVPDVSDKGALPESLPTLMVPDVPFTLETFRVVAPYALAMAVVGLMESLMTAKLVDDVTDTPSHKTRESWAQGVANIVSGFLGSIGGCAMIGQSMINTKVSGARTRISSFTAGILILVLAVALGDWVGMIPMAALVAVMIFVAWSTFDWHSIRLSTLRRMPRSETTVMLSTVVVTVWTSNLAIGVVVGVLVASVLFVGRVAHLASVKRSLTEDEHGAIATYTVEGELFFASSNDLYTMFDYAGDPPRIVIDFAQSHIWDASTVAAVDSVVDKYARYGKTVDLTGLNQVSRRMRVRMSGMLGD